MRRIAHVGLFRRRDAEHTPRPPRPGRARPRGEAHERDKDRRGSGGGGRGGASRDPGAGARAADLCRVAGAGGADGGGAQPHRRRPRRPGGDRAAERAGDGDGLRVDRRGRDHGAAQSGLQGRGVRVLPDRPEGAGARRAARRARRRRGRWRSDWACRCWSWCPRRRAARAASLLEGGEAGNARRGRAWPRRDDVALVLHTSGTTARPKIVPLTHRNVTASARNIARTLALSPRRRLPERDAAVPHPRADRGDARRRSRAAARSSARRASTRCASSAGSMRSGPPGTRRCRPCTRRSWRGRSATGRSSGG